MLAVLQQYCTGSDGTRGGSSSGSRMLGTAWWYGAVSGWSIGIE